jgi:NitT/TauT family transport system substrate-binding protein
LSGHDSQWTRRALLGGAAAATLDLPGMASAGVDKFKLSLEFRIYGANAPAFLATESGVNERLGLDMTPEGSAGSDESIRRVATGTHPFGLADVTTLIAFTAANPAAAPKLVLPVFDRYAAVILSLRRKPVKSLKDLSGITLGAGTSDAGSKIFPALLALNGIDPASINRMTVDVKLRDAMLLAGKVDAVIAFDYTAIFNLAGNGVKLDDIHLLYFSDFGFDFIGNGLIVNPDVLARNPDLVRRVATAVSQAWVAAASRRDQAIASVVRRDKLLDPKVERARLDWVLDKLVLTDNVRRNGLGAIDLARMQHAIEVIREGFQLASTPSVDQIFDGRFMPPAGDRQFG